MNPFLQRRTFPFLSFGFGGGSENGKPPSFWNSLIATVFLACGSGAALYFGPPQWGEQLRTTMRDAIRPGEAIVRRVQDRVNDSAFMAQLKPVSKTPILTSPESTEHKFHQTNQTGELQVASGSQNDFQEDPVARESHDDRDGSKLDELKRLQAELQASQTRCRRLESELAAQKQQWAEAKRDGLSPFRGMLSKPLFLPELLEARIIGQERDTLKQRLTPLLAAGSSKGVVVADLVLEASGDRGSAGASPSRASSLLLDQGEQEGVAADQLVLAGQRILGRVKQVGHWTSTLQPIDDPDYHGHAQLLRETARGTVLGAEGILTGQGRGKCRLEQIPATSPVRVGDLVFTASAESPAQQRLFYGRVIEAAVRPGAECWEIEVAATSETIDNPSTVQILRTVVNPSRLESSAQDTEARDKK